MPLIALHATVRQALASMPGTPSFAQSEGLLQPDLMLLATIKSGRNIVPAFQGVLSDRDILDVIAYLRTLMN